VLVRAAPPAAYGPRAVHLPLLLCAGVAGDWLLQQAERLPPFALLWTGLALAAVLALAGRALCTRAPRCALFAGLLAAALAGAAYAGLIAGARLADELAYADEGRTLRVQGVVASLPAQFEGGQRFAFEIEQVLEAPPVRLPRRVALTWYEAPADLLPAQRWQLSLRLRRPQGNLNPGGFDAEAWLLEQGIRAQGSVRSGPHDEAPRRLQELVWGFNPLVDRARARLRERLQQALAGRPYASVITALVMGDQGPIRDEDWALFNRSGISHLVSISGLHITMIAAAVAVLAGALWRRVPALLRHAGLPAVRALAAIAGGLAYCLLAGWGVPAQRTLLMLSVVALAQCGRLRLGPATILAAAAALVCLWDPWAVLAAGFWLSFGAVACIFLALSGRLAAPPGWRAQLREALRLQGAISIGQVPLTLAIFGQLSLVAPLANAVAIPLVSYLVTPLALAGAALLALGAPAAPLLWGAEALFHGLAGFLQWLTHFDGAWWVLPLAPAWTLCAALAGCAWLLAPPGWPLRGLGALWLLPMLVWPVARPAPGELWVTALDVGQGMALVLETRQHTLVFDTGPRLGAEVDAGGRVLLPYLRGRGLQRLDLLVVSHPDIDHAGGAATLLHGLPVDAVWTSLPPGHRLLAGAQAVQPCLAGQERRLGDLRLQMLSPDAALLANPRASTNARSCVLLAELGTQRVLLTGDVPARQEAQLLARSPQLTPARPLALLVAPHHGSHSSSSAALLAATAPRWASMQLGYRNRFGHPHPEVLARYRAQGVAVVRSDESGAAQWRFGADGSVQLERWRIDHARYWHNQPGGAGAPGPAPNFPTIGPAPVEGDPG
jgi:competence protein ComEC